MVLQLFGLDGRAAIQDLPRSVFARGLTQVFLGIIARLLGVALVSLLTWQTFVHIKVIFDRELESQILGIPAFPFVAVTALGMTALLLALLIDLLDYLSREVLNK